MTRSQQGALIVGNFLSAKGGSRGICEELAFRLPECGWSIITTSSQSNRLMRLADMLWTVWRTRKQYTVAQVDVFSGQAFLWAEAVCQLLNHLEKPYVLTLHGGNLPSFAQRWPGRVRRLLTSTSVVTTPSAYLQSAFANIRDDIRLLPNGLELSAYPFSLRSKPKPRLAWLRAFHAIYSPITAVKALALLTREFPKIELTMFGPDKGDSSLHALQNWARQAGIPDRVCTPGQVPKSEVPSALVLYDIFLNTTTAESFGVSVMEAAALGMCIVTTNVGELPYIWTHGHDALLVPPNDPQAMAEAIRRILTESGLAERLSRNARAKAEQFDWSSVLPQWERLLVEVQARN